MIEFHPTPEYVLKMSPGKLILSLLMLGTLVGVAGVFLYCKGMHEGAMGMMTEMIILLTCYGIKLGEWVRFRKMVKDKVQLSGRVTFLYHILVPLLGLFLIALFFTIGDPFFKPRQNIFGSIWLCFMWILFVITMSFVYEIYYSSVEVVVFNGVNRRTLKSTEIVSVKHMGMPLYLLRYRSASGLKSLLFIPHMTEVLQTERSEISSIHEFRKATHLE